MIFFHDVLSDLGRSLYSDESKVMKQSKRLATVKKALHAVHDQLWYNRPLMEEASKTSLPSDLETLFNILYGYGKHMSTVNDSDRILIEYTVDILGDIANIMTTFVKHKDQVTKYLPRLYEFQAKYANYTPFINKHNEVEGSCFHDLRKEIHLMNMRIWRAATSLTNEFSVEQIVNCFRTTFAMLTDEANEVRDLRSGDLPDIDAQVTMLQCCGHLVTDAYNNTEARLRAALKDPKVNLAHLLKFAKAHVDNVNVGVYTTMILSKVSIIQSDVGYLITTLEATRKHTPTNNDSVRLAFIASLVIHNFLTEKSHLNSLFITHDVPGLLIYNLKTLLEHHACSPEWSMKAFRGYMLCITTAAERGAELREAFDRRGTRALVTRLRNEIAPYEPTLEKYIARFMEPPAAAAAAPAPMGLPVAQPMVVPITCGNCRNMLSVYYGTQYIACPHCRTTLKLF